MTIPVRELEILLRDEAGPLEEIVNSNDLDGFVRFCLAQNWNVDVQYPLTDDLIPVVMTRVAKP